MFPSKPQPPPSTPYYNLEIINLMEGPQPDLGSDEAPTDETFKQNLDKHQKNFDKAYLPFS